MFLASSIATLQEMKVRQFSRNRQASSKSFPTLYLFEKGLQRIVARLLHLAVDVPAELGHDVEQHPVVIHQTAAELGSMSGQQVKTGCFLRKGGREMMFVILVVNCDIASEVEVLPYVTA